ncbi:MAG: GntR family transcriptional regulator [Bifidobacterium subtile]|nr:GntR family transcriptional regulator [Bifidobacterium subtile]MCI1241394.1 GntR family transcriptional regulator [Bifidobacterium subtile]
MTDSTVRNSHRMKSSPSLAVSSRKTTRDRVAEQITELIVTGALPAGARLTEMGLAERLGVSRVPIREAILILQGDQWIDVESLRGARVHVPQPHEIYDIFRVRIALEGMAASLAAERCDESGAHALKEAVARGTRAYRDGEYGLTSDINEEIHAMIARMSGNAVLEKMIGPLEMKTRMYFTAKFTTPRGRVSWDEHAAIADHIARHQAEEAEELMCAHVSAVWHHFHRQ